MSRVARFDRHGANRTRRHGVERDPRGARVRDAGRARLAVLAAMLTWAAALNPSTSSAQPYRHALRAETGVGFILSNPHRELYGTGGGVGLGYELRLHDYVGVEAHMAAYWFASDNPNVTFGSYYAPSLGARFHALPSVQAVDVYAAGRGALVITGGEVRLGVEAELGAEIALGSAFHFGPFVRYVHLFQPDDNNLGAPDGKHLTIGLTAAILFGVENDERLDADGDEIPDFRDECPEEPEDFDSFEDADGCPDPDNDNDGILDAVDPCPLAPEDADGFQDSDGCPDPDNDNDGIPDDMDECPDQPEDLDGEEDEDGCPDGVFDQDGDGVEDARDQCIDVPEDRDGFEDEDGCPDPDNDEDRVLDVDDECPTAPGTIDNNGCPQSVRMSVNEIQILLRIEFRTDQARLRRSARPIIAEIAALLLVNPQIHHLRVEGHADSRDTPESNMVLSQERAESVRAALIEHGVDAERLTTVGYGETRPLLSGNSMVAHTANRRVEFVIVD